MKTSLNLLPPMLRRQQLLRRRVVQWSMVLCLGAVLGSLAQWYVLRQHHVLERRLEVLAREHQPTRTLLNELINMREQLAELEQQELVANELEHQRQVLALLGVISHAGRETNGRLRVTQVKLTDLQSVQPADASRPAASSPGSFVVSGVSLDNPAVAELMVSLQDSGLFSHVEVVSMKQRDGGDVELRDYELRCEF